MGVYRDTYLPFSEQWITQQAENFKVFEPVYFTRTEIADRPVYFPSPKVNIERDYGSFESLKLKFLGRSNSLFQEIRNMDVVLSHFLPDALRISREVSKAGRPHFAFAHGGDVTGKKPELPKSFGQFVLNNSWNKVNDSFSGILAVSEYVKECLISKGVSEHKIHVCYLGAASSNNKDYLSRTFDLAFLGRFTEEKGFNLVLQLLDSANDRTKVALAGSGPLQAKLEKKLISWGDNAPKYFGAVSPAKSKEIIGDSKCVIVPSIVGIAGRQEAISMVIQEAFAAGTPVVASYTGGIPEAVDPSWGALFIPGSLSGLQQCIKSVLVKEKWDSLNLEVRTQWERKFNLSNTVAYIESVILEGLQ